MNESNMAMEVKIIALDALQPFSKNSVTHNRKNKETIKKSLQEFGQYHDLIVLRETMEVLIGNGTFECLKDLGYKEAKCKLIDLDADKAIALCMIDNKSSDLHKWEEEILARLFHDMPEGVYDLTGFDAPDISNLLDLFEEVDLSSLIDDADEVPDLVTEQDCEVKLGDVWELGEHLLLCGDSTDIDQVRRIIDCEIDLLHTDPPYNVSYEGKGKDKMTIDNDSMSPEEFASFLDAAFAVASELLQAGSGFYIWYADCETINFRQACIKNNLLIKQGLVWRKNMFVLGRQDYQWIHEPCLYGWKEGAAHYWSGGRTQVTVLDYAKPVKNDIHPTMKPIGLIEPLIKNSCRNGGAVLDLFGGSGSTLIACENLNRRARLVELSPLYCQRIIHRWEELTKQKAKIRR